MGIEPLSVRSGINIKKWNCLEVYEEIKVKKYAEILF